MDRAPTSQRPASPPSQAMKRAIIVIAIAFGVGLLAAKFIEIASVTPAPLVLHPSHAASQPAPEPTGLDVRRALLDQYLSERRARVDETVRTRSAGELAMVWAPRQTARY